MKVTILKSFPYAHDGNRIEMLRAGTEDCEVRDDLVNGLAAAGLVKRPDTQKALPGMAMPSVEADSPENKMLAGPDANKIATDTTPQRDRRKR